MCVVAFLLSCELFVSLRCGVCHKYQNSLYNYNKNRLQPLSPPHVSLRLFLCIEYPDYLPDMACMHMVLFPNALEGNISYVANGWCKYLKWFETETKVFIGDSDDGNEWEVLIMFRKLNFLSYRRWQKQWLARIILYGASPLKSTTTHSWSFISAFLYRHDHHYTLITNLTNRTLRDIILLFDFCTASGQLKILFTQYYCILWSLFPVLNCLYMVPSRFCDRYLMQFDLSLPCDTFSFSLLLLEHIG